MLVDMSLIETGRRLRGVNAEQVEALISSISEVGLLSPIALFPREVMRSNISVPGYGLVAGLHRLEACRRLGLVEIEAMVVDIDELDRQIAECDENLCGVKLTPAERAMFTARRKDAYEAKHPETRHGANQHTRTSQSENSSFTTDTASRTGHGRSTVARDATRGERIADDVLEQVRGTALDKGVHLDRIAAAPREQQHQVVREIAEGRPKPVPLPKDEIETEQDWKNAMMRLWNRGAGRLAGTVYRLRAGAGV